MHSSGAQLNNIGLAPPKATPCLLRRPAEGRSSPGISRFVISSDNESDGEGGGDGGGVSGTSRLRHSVTPGSLLSCNPAVRGRRPACRRIESDSESDSPFEERRERAGAGGEAAGREEAALGGGGGVGGGGGSGGGTPSDGAASRAMVGLEAALSWRGVVRRDWAQLRATWLHRVGSCGDDVDRLRGLLAHLERECLHPSRLDGSEGGAAGLGDAWLRRRSGWHARLRHTTYAFPSPALSSLISPSRADPPLCACPSSGCHPTLPLCPHPRPSQARGGLGRALARGPGVRTRPCGRLLTRPPRLTRSWARLPLLLPPTIRAAAPSAASPLRPSRAPARRRPRRRRRRRRQFWRWRTRAVAAAEPAATHGRRLV